MRRKKGFTLVEMIVVVIIISILATLATGRYQRIAEKGRASEAKKILGMIRQAEAAYYLENLAYSDNTTKIGFADLPYDTNSTEYYFVYDQTVAATTGGIITATRCKGAGKAPNWGIAYKITLNTTSGLFSCTEDGII